MSSMLTRRAFLSSNAAALLAAALPMPRSAAAAAGRTSTLRAAPGRARLVPEPHGETPVWCYNGAVPGPEIRVRQGDRVRIVAENGLEEETTVHWHGIRLPNAMDGVPHLTQPPIRPGGTFAYEFDAVDAGTFWYHPHQQSPEQVGRGLYGPFVVEEIDPIRVDRDMTWVLDDWRLNRSAAIRGDFGNAHDLSHNGRLGNTITVNGRFPDAFAVRKGERIRLRLVNAANARIFGLEFRDHEPTIIALDGQPAAPHAPDGGLVVLGPAMRADVVLDMKGEPGSRVSVIDRFYRNREYRLLDFVYGAKPLRSETPDWTMELPANRLPEPDIGTARRTEVVFNGGMMGGAVMAELGGSMPGGLRSGRFWFVNGVAAESHMAKPLLVIERGRSYVIAMTNATAWHHPIHLHGHSFRILSRNGKPAPRREWRDTALMEPRERVEIAFVADNPGDWMFHCHVLGHQASGMMASIRVI